MVTGSGEIWEKTVTEERATGGRTNQNQMEYGKELAGQKKVETEILALVIAGIDASPEAATAAHGSGLITSSPSAVRNGLVAETFMGGRPRRLS